MHLIIMMLSSILHPYLKPIYPSALLPATSSTGSNRYSTSIEYIFAVYSIMAIPLCDFASVCGSLFPLYNGAIVKRFHLSGVPVSLARFITAVRQLGSLLSIVVLYILSLMNDPPFALFGFILSIHYVMSFTVHLCFVYS